MEFKTTLGAFLVQRPNDASACQERGRFEVHGSFTYTFGRGLTQPAQILYLLQALAAALRAFVTAHKTGTLPSRMTRSLRISKPRLYLYAPTSLRRSRGTNQILYDSFIRITRSHFRAIPPDFPSQWKGSRAQGGSRLIPGERDARLTRRSMTAGKYTHGFYEESACRWAVTESLTALNLGECH